MTLSVGATAPALDVTAHNGEDISLKTLNASGQVVVVFFYPKNETRVCTAEACAFRDAYEDFRDAGAVVIGVSGDKDASHQSFAENHSLPFHLVSDRGGKFAKAWDVKKNFGLIPGRATYVVDKNGKIAHAFVSATDSHKHVNEAMETVKRLSSS